MLILTRKDNESVIIDDQIEIKVLEVEGNRVQLGIEAPDSVIIHRKEVYEEIQTENKVAAVISKEDSTKLSKILEDSVKSSY